jgi:hypothetical protein
MGLLTQYSYLQILDLLTTLAFIANGVSEGNPLVAFAMSATASPWIGLAMVKAAGVVLGLYCWRQGRLTLLTRANFGFAMLIAWNLLALVVASHKA